MPFHLCRYYLIWTLSLLLICVHCEGIASAQAIFYVSPSGSDDSLGNESQPFKTIEKARAVVRSINKHMTSDIVVYLRSGEYVLSTPLVFDQWDSGTNGFSVVYMAFPGERPLLSGGQRITGWTEVGDGIYKAPVGSLMFRQLYVNGIRAIRARTPNSERYYQLRSWEAADKRIEINSGEIGRWQRLNQVEMVILGKGVNQANLRVGSFSVVESGGHFRFLADPALGDNSLYRRAIRKLVKKLVASAFVIPLEPERTRIFEQEYPPKESRPYYFENAYEFLDEPGEWYLNTATNELFYKPRRGEELVDVTVVAPRLETLVELKGTLDAPVHHIQFRGLIFEHTTWLLPTNEGFIGDYASIVFTQRLPEDEITSYPGHRMPAALHLEAASHIKLERNIFRHLGSSALNLYVGVHDSSIVGNVISDVSGSGISVDLNLRGNPTDTREICRGISITNNHISKIGQDYFQSVGIVAGYTEGLIIEHNELSNMPYIGIGVGWGWKNVDNASRNNLVRYNDVHNVLEMMADGGGIATLSKQPGTEIAENYIHDLIRPPTAGDYTNGGIFLDNGSNFIKVQNNVFQNVQDMNVKLNDVGPNNVLSNNGDASPTVIALTGLEPEYQNIKLDLQPLHPLSEESHFKIGRLDIVVFVMLLGLSVFYYYRRYHRERRPPVLRH